MPVLKGFILFSRGLMEGTGKNGGFTVPKSREERQDAKLTFPRTKTLSV